jgi:carbon monoxide dehydrogenase subunit G
MYGCRPVGIEFCDTAPHRFTTEVVIHATPEQIFEVFEDPDSWVVWALPIRRVEWTSPRPFGVGTTRTVTMTGGLVGKEEFIAWERGRRMAFRFTEASMAAVTAFAEDYQLSDAGNGRTRVRWVMAMEARGANDVGLRLFGWTMRLGLAFLLRRFQTLVETRYPAARAA